MFVFCVKCFASQNCEGDTPCSHCGDYVAQPSHRRTQVQCGCDLVYVWYTFDIILIQVGYNLCIFYKFQVLCELVYVTPVRNSRRGVINLLVSRSAAENEDKPDVEVSELQLCNDAAETSDLNSNSVPTKAMPKI